MHTLAIDIVLCLLIKFRLELHLKDNIIYTTNTNIAERTEKFDKINVYEFTAQHTPCTCFVIMVYIYSTYTLNT